MKQIRTLFLFVVPVLMAVPASAHHSLSMYDRATSKSVSGTVKEFEWTNPHAWIRVVVAKPNGEMEEWHFEGGGVGRLSQRGWSKDMMHEIGRAHV